MPQRDACAGAGAGDRACHGHRLTASNARIEPSGTRRIHLCASALLPAGEDVSPIPGVWQLRGGGGEQELIGTQGGQLLQTWYQGHRPVPGRGTADASHPAPLPLSVSPQPTWPCAGSSTGTAAPTGAACRSTPGCLSPEPRRSVAR